MKKSLIAPLLCACITVGLLLSSCSKDVYRSAVKKRYQNRQYVKKDVAKKKLAKLSLKSNTHAPEDLSTPTTEISSLLPVKDAPENTPKPLQVLREKLPSKINNIAPIAQLPKLKQQLRKRGQIAHVPVPSHLNFDPVVERQLYKHGMAGKPNDIPFLIYFILALIIPPLAVFLWRGLDFHFWLNLIFALLLIFYIVAIIHAILVITDTIR